MQLAGQALARPKVGIDSGPQSLNRDFTPTLEGENHQAPSMGRTPHLVHKVLDQSEDEGAETSRDNELERWADEIISGRSVSVPADQIFSELRAKYL